MYSYRFHSRHVHTFSSPLPDIISRSHSGESLITGANTFSTHPNFSITQLLVRGALEIHCVSVRRRPAGSRSLPSGPKLICCGQIVFSGVKCELLSGCRAPRCETPLFVSATPDICRPHSWGREVITGQFHPYAPPCLSSISKLPSCFLHGLFF